MPLQQVPAGGERQGRRWWVPVLLWQDFTGSWKWKIWLPLCPWGSVALRTYPHVGLGGPRFPAAASPRCMPAAPQGCATSPACSCLPMAAFPSAISVSAGSAAGAGHWECRRSWGKKLFPAQLEGLCFEAGWDQTAPLCTRGSLRGGRRDPSHYGKPGHSGVLRQGPGGSTAGVIVQGRGGDAKVDGMHGAPW